MRRIAAKTPVAPILEEPRAGASQATQLLYGHCALVRTSEARWLRVVTPDGYEGWLHEGYTVACEDGKEVEWGWDTGGEVSLGCSVRNTSGATIDLPLGAVIGENQCVAGRSMDLSARRETFPAAADAIVASAAQLFQGAYYQWGGVSPWGADCSGMVQSVFALHGIHLLRDAWQQATQGLPVEGGIEQLKPADLLFFSDREDGHITHVAIAMGNSKVVHVAIGRGGHNIETLDDPDDYAAGLISRFRFARRIIG